MNGNNNLNGELREEDLDFTLGGYGSNQVGTEMNSAHANVFDPKALADDQQFWGINPEHLQEDADQKTRTNR